MVQTEQVRFAGGFLNVNKPIGWTSTDVVRKVKRLTGVKKVGHGGTLDPIATGVLPICLGAATRFAETVLLGNKAYRLTVRLGASTDTFDSTGSVTREVDASAITVERVGSILPQFTGAISQAPPAYSAIKRGGRPLYELARAGVEVVTEPRQVHVLRLELTAWAPPEFVLDIECGHGFYARSLANDIGAALGGAAHLSGLVRTKAGRFGITDACDIEELERRATEGSWREMVLPLDYTLQHLRAAVLDPLKQELVWNGQALPAGALGEKPGDFSAGGRVRAYSQEGDLIAILSCELAGMGWRPVTVIHAG
ncbi:MAG: tRNA pseudouridine(55) synthase TruB [Dehalococcoidia bacterium]|nr:tRNA pseudouridine(55) synthase TruB [Dehalococcoidia bacterium]MSQ34276.1 tRNA pseudouridine(55) synthase TruB [Dehalococcoidia bacterium]